VEYFAFMKRVVSGHCVLNKALYCPTEVRTNGRVSCGIFPLFKYVSRTLYYSLGFPSAQGNAFKLHERFEFFFFSFL
jgi:hypothetical protein